MNNYQEYTFKTEDNFELYGQSWNASNNAKAVLIVVHGLLEHSSMYKELAEVVNQHNIHLLAVDIRGFGKSSVNRLKKLTVENICKDLEIITHDTEELYPGLPRILYGFDLGALTVLSYASTKVRKIAGVIAVSPIFKWEHHQSSNRILFGTLVKRFFPNWMWEIKIFPEALSNNDKTAREISNDALVRNKIPVKLFIDILEFGRRISKCVYKINVPLLVMHGTDDEITSISFSKKFVQHTSEKTQLMEWEGFKHMIHKDTGKDQVFQYVVEWIDKIL